MPKTFAPSTFAVLALACALAIPGQAAQPKEPVRDLDVKAFFLPELSISSSHALLETRSPAFPTARPGRASSAARAKASRTRPTCRSASIPARARRPTSWARSRSSPATASATSSPWRRSARLGAQRAKRSTRRGRRDGGARLHRPHAATSSGIDVAQLGAARVTQVNADLWQVSIPQVLPGHPRAPRPPRREHQPRQPGDHRDRDVGQRRRPADSRRRCPAEAALDAGFAYVDGRPAEDVILEPPRARGGARRAAGAAAAAKASPGRSARGYGHRLVWTFVFQRPPDDRAVGGHGRRARPARCSRCRT